MKRKKSDATKVLKWILMLSPCWGGLLHIYKQRPWHHFFLSDAPPSPCGGRRNRRVDGIDQNQREKAPRCKCHCQHYPSMCCVLYGVSELLFNYEAIAKTAGTVSTQIVICCTLLVIAILFLQSAK